MRAVTPSAPCATCGDLVCFTLVVTGRGGESQLCVRCYLPPKALTAKQVKSAAPRSTGQLVIGGKR